MHVTIGETLAAINRVNIKREPPEGSRIQARIIAVNYVSRRIQCQARGHANLRRVRVADNINLGTPNNKKVYPGDIAKLEKNSKNGKWECIGIIHKVKCPPGVPVSDAVEVDVSYEYSNSNIVNDYGSFIVPETPFIPDVGSLGQISIPSQLPYGTIICGYPVCSDCLSPADGDVLTFNATSECWEAAAGGGGGGSYDVGGGIAGPFEAPQQQNIGLPHGATWTTYFVDMTGSADWEIYLNGVFIVGGTGTDSGTISETFSANSKFSFVIASGSGEDLFYGVGT